jgi:hypothetical protein
MNVFNPAGIGASPDPCPLVLGNTRLQYPPSIVLDLWDPRIPPESLSPSDDSRRGMMPYRTATAFEERKK